MNKLFLHVGPHKTGTTAIQKFLLDNTGACFQQNLFYPRKYIHIFGHHCFRSVVKERKLNAVEKAFFLDSKHDILLSSEDFISLDIADFEYLRESLDPLNIVIVFAWRRASYKLYSIWQEVIKHGGTIDFFEYYYDHLARPSTSQMLSPDLKLNTFVNVFGKQNVKVLDYDTSRANNSLFQDFIKVCGLTWNNNFSVSKIDDTAKNQSMQLHDIEIVRALNGVMAKKYDYHGSQVRLAYNQYKGNLNRVHLSELVNIIREHTHKKVVGNYFIDTRAEKLMQKRFKENMLNYQDNHQTKPLLISSSRWMSNINVHDLLSSLSNELYNLNMQNNAKN
ncbi:hypothetical protein [Agaribacter flavus]|uniref:Sulfotransferase domain-containing protein n=1 Tax=Agaribacter flavus TaxID=1902781 RepID=A0ABV7FNQ3_9ALTE